MPRRTVTRPKLRAYFPDGKWHTRIHPLPDHGIVYVKNAKVATSTTLLWLHRLHTGKHDYLPAGISIHFENQVPTADDVGRATAAHMLDGDAYRFTFVRDPIHRVESAYLNKIVEAADGLKGRRRRIQRLLDQPTDPDRVPTFEEFITVLTLEDPIAMDPHWRPQHLNLMHPLVTYDHIGRLETYADDLATITEQAGLPHVPVEAQNTTPPRRDSLFDGQPALLATAREVYAQDFELYGY